jgi:hypothetical protein
MRIARHRSRQVTEADDAIARLGVGRTTYSRGVKFVLMYGAPFAVEKAEAAKIAERIKVLGRDGYLRQYAIDHGLNPYQPSPNGLMVD